MKNRRNVVIALLLIAVLCVGIGFATMNDTISFAGKVSYSDEFDIVWTAINDTEGKLTEVTAIPAEGVESISVSLDTSDWNVNDTYTFTATVKSLDKYNAENVIVQNKDESALDPYFDVTVDIDKDTLQANGADAATVTVTIEMVAYPQSKLTDVEFTFEVFAERAA